MFQKSMISIFHKCCLIETKITRYFKRVIALSASLLFFTDCIFGCTLKNEELNTFRDVTRRGRWFNNYTMIEPWLKRFVYTFQIFYFETNSIPNIFQLLPNDNSAIFVPFAFTMLRNNLNTPLLDDWETHSCGHTAYRQENMALFSYHAFINDGSSQSFRIASIFNIFIITYKLLEVILGCSAQLLCLVRTR